jgi:hypothetical protein
MSKIIIPQLLLVMLIAGCGGCSSELNENNAIANRPSPTPVTLVISDQIVFHPKSLSGGDNYHYISGKNGELWVLLQELSQPLKAARINGDKDFQFKPICPADWAGVTRVSVTNDESGNPVVVMMGYVKNSSKMQVVVRKRLDNNWSNPIEIDRFDGSGTFGSMISLLDSKGRIHVVYDRHLEPRESYAVGFIIVDGEFPDKCFHAFFDGEKWSRSKSTTGKGKYYVDPLFLSEMPSGNICLGLEVSPLRTDAESQSQIWDGNNWSKLAEKWPKEAFYVKNTCVFDYWGNAISWGSVNDGYQCFVSRRDNPNKTDIRDLKSMPTVTRDRNGRIVLFSHDSSQAEIRMWNGEQWSDKLTFPIDENPKRVNILANPDGNLYVVIEGDNKTIIQRIKETVENQ